MDNFYFLLELAIDLDADSATTLEQIKDYAFSECDISGIEEYAIDEAAVDEILKEESFSGGDVDFTTINKVEKHLEFENSETLKFYFNSADLLNDERNAKKLEEYIANHLPKNRVVISKIPITDWDAEWRKSYKPITINDYLEIIPEWDKATYQSKAKYKVYIYPGLGFGTGGHQTTFLCLVLLEKVIFIDQLFTNLKSQTCLDFGAGSGILGITARTIGFSSVDLLDIDEGAILNCKQNFGFNNMESDPKLSVQKVAKEYKDAVKKYDLVFANILLNILILKKEYLLNSLKDNGVLILSGILTNQKEELLEAFNQNTNIEVLHSVDKDAWSAIALRKRKV